VYVIVVYDVAQERVARVCQYLRRYLHWVQNSAFEGELSEARLAQVQAGLRDLLDLNHDSVYFYILRDAKWVRKQVVGRSKAPTDNLV